MLDCNNIIKCVGRSIVVGLLPHCTIECVHEGEEYMKEREKGRVIFSAGRESYRYLIIYTFLFGPNRGFRL